MNSANVLSQENLCWGKGMRDNSPYCFLSGEAGKAKTVLQNIPIVQMTND